MNLIVRLRLILLWLLPFALGCSGRPQAEGNGLDDVLVIRNVTVIDGTESAPLENMALLIRGNRIAALGSLDQIGIPGGAQVYDGEGRYLIPGLWDMHTHVLWEPFVEEGFLRLFVVNGVTGIRDMGGTLDVVRAVREGGRYYTSLNPRVVAAGPWLNQFEIDPRAGTTVQTPEEARQLVAALAQTGVDFIKVYTFLSREVFLAVLDEAKAHGLPVAGHVPQGIGSAEASDRGMRSIEHMRVETGGFCNEVAPPNCEELFATFRRNDTWQTPTLVIRRNRAFLDKAVVVEDPDLRFAPSYLREEWEGTRQRRLSTESFDDLKKRYSAERELAGALHRAGVPILAGSDAGDLFSLAGFSLHEELGLLVDAGLSPREALRAATLAPAEYLEATDSLGTVAEGKLADLVLLDANPLADIRNTEMIHAVVLDGQLFDRADLDELLNQIRHRAKASTSQN